MPIFLVIVIVIVNCPTLMLWVCCFVAPSGEWRWKMYQGCRGAHSKYPNKPEVHGSSRGV